MKTVKIGNFSSSYLADHANTLYTMAQNKTIASPGYGLDITGTAKNRDFRIDGKIDADLTAVRIGLDGADAAKVDFTIGETGRIISKAAGIQSYGLGHVIHNEGTIEAASDGIGVHGGQTVINSGDITGFNGINLFAVDDQLVLIRNTGSITGTHYAIYGSSNGDRVVNNGDLTGDVQLVDGNDTFVYKGGTIDGVVRGGWGDDVYIVKAAQLNIAEESGQGEDTVFSSVDYTLQSNVENLFLKGKGNLDGIGNGGDNELYGNSGKNYLNGGDGFDVLHGGAGNDILTGGVGSDEFFFARGDGRDIVSDYEAGFDEIHFLNPKHDTSFTDMIAGHAEEKFGDVVITYGKDVVVLKNHEISDLQQDDFIFFG
jgi:Ca2+-binding RTX toxin-like protein